jgi:hypothetical protein
MAMVAFGRQEMAMLGMQSVNDIPGFLQRHGLWRTGNMLLTPVSRYSPRTGRESPVLREAKGEDKEVDLISFQELSIVPAQSNPTPTLQVVERVNSDLSYDMEDIIDQYLNGELEDTDGEESSKPEPMITIKPSNYDQLVKATQGSLAVEASELHKRLLRLTIPVLNETGNCNEARLRATLVHKLELLD